MKHLRKILQEDGGGGGGGGAGGGGGGAGGGGGSCGGGATGGGGAAMGSTSAGGVAGYRAPLFSKQPKKKRTIMIKRVVPETEQKPQGDTNVPLIRNLTEIDIPGVMPPQTASHALFQQFVSDVFDLLKRRIPAAVRRDPVRPEMGVKREVLNFQRNWRPKLEGQWIDNFEIVMERMFDSEAVLSRLKSLEKRADKTAHIKDTKVFGVHDDQGNTVLITVPEHQSDSFEAALQRLLVPGKFDKQDIERPEIEEVIFNLKDHFNILDVVWPKVKEDEEDLTDVGAIGDTMPGSEEGGDLDAQLGADLEGADMGAAPPAPETDVSNVLQQVINVMMADAEARKADADARKQEAKTKEVEALAKQAQGLVKKEEEMLDMETQMKDEKERDREIKRLAQLAKWKKDMDSGEEPSFGLGSGMKVPPSITATKKVEVESEEKTTTVATPVVVPKLAAATRSLVVGKLTAGRVADYILSRVK